MAQALYKVVLSGEMHDDFEKDAVIQELATLFKCPKDKAAGLLAGKPTKLKKEMLQDTAQKYCARLDKAGVKCGIKPIAQPELSLDLSIEPTGTPDIKPPGLSLESVETKPEQVSIEDIPSSNQPPTEQAVDPGSIVCPKCKTKQPQSEQCSKCGVFIQKYLAQQNISDSVQVSSQENDHDTDDEEDSDEMSNLSIFVGDKFEDEYRLRFSKIRDNGGKYVRDWNWSACILTGSWLIYRKMYVFAAAYFILVSVTPGWFSVGMYISMGAFGSFLYYRFAQYQINKVPGSGIDRANEIIAKGGVIPIPAVIGITMAGSLLISMIYVFMFNSSSNVENQQNNSDVKELVSFIEDVK